jgi:sulfopyruvate decarboxylase TPP-binding subunit
MSATAKSETMTTAQAAVRTLAVNGIDTVYCLPGVQNNFLFDALYDEKDKIRSVHTRHEQGAAYMALGAAMATGRPAVFSVVPGPGVLNTTAALSTAYACTAPVMCLTGQIPSAMIGRGVGMLHELPDQLAVMKLLTNGPTVSRIPPTRCQKLKKDSASYSQVGRVLSLSNVRWIFGPRRQTSLFQPCRSKFRTPRSIPM